MEKGETGWVIRGGRQQSENQLDDLGLHSQACPWNLPCYYFSFVILFILFSGMPCHSLPTDPNPSYSSFKFEQSTRS